MTRTARRRFAREMESIVDGLAIGAVGPVFLHCYDQPAGGKWVDDVIPGKLVALDRTSGEQLWVSPCEVGYGRGFGAGFGPDQDLVVLGPSAHGHRIVRMRLDSGELLGVHKIDLFDAALVGPDVCITTTPKAVVAIDTSGSMFNYSWNRLLEVVTETLEIYPQLKGIQVMNDEGDYMFSTYRGQWIEDSPARRQAILSRLRTWNPFSDSSPVEGIIAAIREFYDPDKKISVYVLGDDFTGNSIRDVINTVDRINTETATGERLVRIHGIGFPVQFAQPPRYQATGRRFAALMRELARKNGGTFVGLNDFY